MFAVLTVVGISACVSLRLDGPLWCPAEDWAGEGDDSWHYQLHWSRDLSESAPGGDVRLSVAKKQYRTIYFCSPKPQLRRPSEDEVTREELLLERYSSLLIGACAGVDDKKVVVLCATQAWAHAHDFPRGSYIAVRCTGCG